MSALLETAIRQQARQLGFDACGFTSAHPPDHAQDFQRWLTAGNHGEMKWLERNAAKRLEPQIILPGAQSVICLAAVYDAETAAAPSGAGVVARYARYQDYHTVMGEKLKILTAEINRLGGPDTRSLWYVDTGPILERDLAQRAGLGFIGKHTNLIGRRLGNWFFLAEILTTLKLAPDAPERNHCGACTRCLAACPTHALTAPFQLDARRCISYLTIELKGSIPLELRPLIGSRIFGCDDCLAVCPWNRFATAGSMMKPYARPDLATPALLKLLSLDEAAFRALFTGTPMERTRRRGLLRNVCVALGNVGDASALPDLKKAASDPEPLIAEHAAWAVDQIHARAATAPHPPAPAPAKSD